MSREDRRQARIERRRRKLAKAAIAASMPPLIALPENSDPLIVYGRDEQPIGHPLRNLWAPNPCFLVCSGPSLNDYPLDCLRQRGVVSLGLNNASAYAPVTAATIGDPASKFSSNIFLDPRVLKLVPRTRLKDRVRAKVGDEFRYTRFRVKDCPNVYGFERDCAMDPNAFLTKTSATWGVNSRGAELTGLPKCLFSLFLALRLCWYLGSRRVYLLGVDFRMLPGKQVGNYAFGQVGSGDNNNASYALAIRLLSLCEAHFKDMGYEIFNCNPNSNLRQFPHVPFSEALEDCRGGVQREPYDLSGYYEKNEEKRGSGA